MQNHKFLIVGGATKSGTTSLHNYLADHPEVCSAELKETRFFLDNEYPVKTLNLKSSTREGYLNLFNCQKPDKIKIEGTPDYLYSSGTAQKIVKILNQDSIKLLFILRNPVDRFISWYKFAMQDGKISPKDTLKDFYLANIKNDLSRSPQHLRALEQGLYSNYLPSFFNSIEAKKIKIIFFEDFIEQTNATLKDISSYIGIDPSFYNSYTPKVFNKTVQYRYPELNNFFRKTKRNIREKLVKMPYLKQKIKEIGTHFEHIYGYLNEKGKSDFSGRIEEEHIYMVKDYYSDEIKLFNNREYMDRFI